MRREPCAGLLESGGETRRKFGREEELRLNLGYENRGVGRDGAMSDDRWEEALRKSRDSRQSRVRLKRARGGEDVVTVGQGGGPRKKRKAVLFKEPAGGCLDTPGAKPEAEKLRTDGATLEPAILTSFEPMLTSIYSVLLFSSKPCLAPSPPAPQYGTVLGASRYHDSWKRLRILCTAVLLFCGE
ncbi:hypothetical protein BJX76DRAFT_223615 [Aspergillus varians]